MVHGEGGLESIHRLGSGGEHHTGVVDEHVDAWAALEDLLGARSDRVEVAQIEDHQADALAPASVLDFLERSCAPTSIPGGDDDLGAGTCQSGGGLQPNPGVGTGNDDRLFFHVCHVHYPSHAAKRTATTRCPWPRQVLGPRSAS